MFQNQQHVWLVLWSGKAGVIFHFYQTYFITFHLLYCNFLCEHHCHTQQKSHDDSGRTLKVTVYRCARKKQPQHCSPRFKHNVASRLFEGLRFNLGSSRKRVSWILFNRVLSLLYLKVMSFRNVSKEALVGSVALGVVFVTGYFFGKRSRLTFLIQTLYFVATTQRQPARNDVCVRWRKSERGLDSSDLMFTLQEL